jgi:hypothetical protein
VGNIHCDLTTSIVMSAAIVVIFVAVPTLASHHHALTTKETEPDTILIAPRALAEKERTTKKKAVSAAGSARGITDHRCAKEHAERQIGGFTDRSIPPATSYFATLSGVLYPNHLALAVHFPGSLDEVQP